jgi:tetratricopeptide (TPR) repeat protein
MGNCLCFKRSVHAPARVVSDEEHKLVGNKLFKEGKYDEALVQYSDAISKNPTVSIYFSNRALCYYKLKKFSFALADSNSAYKLDPSNFKAAILSIKSKASLALAGNMQYFQDALATCKQLKISANTTKNVQIADYCKNLKKKIKSLFYYIQQSQTKALLLEYYSKVLPEKAFSTLSKILERKVHKIDGLLCPLTIVCFR